MYTAKQANEELNSSPITASQVKGEIFELVEAVIKLDGVEFKEEVADVIYFSLCHIESRFGLNLPLVGAMPTINKIKERFEKWEKIFEHHGLAFDKKYLVGGSNYKKQEKVDAALFLARIESK